MVVGASGPFSPFGPFCPAWPGCEAGACDGVMPSRVCSSAADSENELSPISAVFHFPCHSTAANVPSPSPGHSDKVAESRCADATAPTAVPGRGAGPPICAGAAPSAPPRLNWFSQQL